MTKEEALKWIDAARTALKSMGKPACYRIFAIDDLQHAIEPIGRMYPVDRKRRLKEFEFNLGKHDSELGELVCLFCITVLRSLEARQ